MALHFRYRGSLPAVNDRNKRLSEKQAIRRQLHPQIVCLMEKPPSDLRPLSDPYRRNVVGRFLIRPVICARLGIACDLGLTIYSRDPFGAVIQNADLDNRLKTLFDALRIPTELELPKEDRNRTPTPDLFWVLLEDDNLITDLSIKSKRLLVPPREEEKESDIELEISLDVKYDSAI